jgi:hypothetical protein
MRSGGVLALWVEVLILALRDWAASPGPFRVGGGETHYAAQPPTGRSFGPEWFGGPHCRNIVDWIGPAGIKCVRYYFLEKSHLPLSKRQKVLYMIGELEKRA